ncbi:MAG: hypothetical protein L7U67_06205 [Schleiferiaceae bacterium]|nr:hypothetical protein [Schleiferiaceae bacterium]
MKKLLACSLLLGLFACTQNVEDPLNLESIEESSTTENISQMSIHLFDLPDGISEEEYIADIEKLNSFFIALGYGKNYTVLKVADDNEADEYRYALVSSYPSAEAYAASHDQGPEYDAFVDELYAKYQSIWDTEIYRKVFTIN